MSHDLGAAFRALHRPGDPFVLANAWDAGSARMLAALGAQAIGTTSAGYAFTLGRPDMGHVTRDEALAHAEALVAATPLPVSGDLENGFGDAPEDVAQTVRRAAEVGLAGCSIEDTALPTTDAYPRADAVERIHAAVAAARALARDFVLVARADGVMNGAYDLDEAIARVRAFEAVGADCVYVPAPGGEAALARVVGAVSVPVNALAVGPLAQLGRTQFATLGVARISLGSALARMTHRVIYDAAQAMLGQGRFDSHAVVSGKAVDELLLKGAR
jgi:2-methylisocitrate lyase-like PEP mutase family enzyme